MFGVLRNRARGDLALRRRAGYGRRVRRVSQGVLLVGLVVGGFVPCAEAFARVDLHARVSSSPLGASGGARVLVGDVVRARGGSARASSVGYYLSKDRRRGRG